MKGQKLDIKYGKIIDFEYVMLIFFLGNVFLYLNHILVFFFFFGHHILVFSLTGFPHTGEYIHCLHLF